MTIGLIGRKCGMTRLFKDNGQTIPVTAIAVIPNRITQVKTINIDGYRAIQVTQDFCKSSRISKAEAGHFIRSGVKAGIGLWEFRIKDFNENFLIGQELNVTRFSVGQIIDVIGYSKGKGFQGCVKRHNFSMQDATHGNSISHRAPGSIGQCQTPGRVWKGKKMAGHMGHNRVTIQNIKIASINETNNVIFVKGPVPGANGTKIIIQPSVKIKS